MSTTVFAAWLLAGALGCSGTIDADGDGDRNGPGDGSEGPGAADGPGSGGSGAGGAAGDGADPGVGDDAMPDPDADPGRVTLHRLNRVEYANTVRDLLGAKRRALTGASTAQGPARGGPPDLANSRPLTC